MEFDVHLRGGEPSNIPYKLPDEEHPLGYEYKIRYFCYCAAQGDAELYKRMFEHWPLSEVHDVVTLARQYSQREEEPAGGKKWQ